MVQAEDYLKNPAAYPGRNVAVIGGGNTAIDAARVALRRGADRVQILYRRLYSMSDEEYRAHQATVNETYLERENAWKIGRDFRYYPVKPEKYK